MQVYSSRLVMPTDSNGITTGYFELPLTSGYSSFDLNPLLLNVTGVRLVDIRLDNGPFIFNAANLRWVIQCPELSNGPYLYRHNGLSEPGIIGSFSSIAAMQPNNGLYIGGPFIFLEQRNLSKITLRVVTSALQQVTAVGATVLGVTLEFLHQGFL